MAGQDIIGTYGFVIGLISMVILLLLLLTYLASKFLRIQSFEAWFNIELSEFFASFFVIFFAIAMFEGSNALSIALSGGGTSTVDTASKFINERLGDTLAAIEDNTKIQICISTLSTFSRRTGEFVLTLTYKVFPGLDSFLGISNVISYGLTMIFGSFNAQLMLFQIIDATMIRLFLPAGIILRFFPPTREAGMFLIAFAIGFQAIFPLTYAINQKLLETIGFEGYNTGFLQTYNLWSICGVKYLVFGALGNPSFAPFGIPIVPGAIPIFGQLFRMFFSEGVVSATTPHEFQYLMENLANLSLVAFFMPAFSLTITFAFINSFIKFVLMKI